jgi:hypothetical protein
MKAILSVLVFCGALAAGCKSNSSSKAPAAAPGNTSAAKTDGGSSGSSGSEADATAHTGGNGSNSDCVTAAAMQLADEADPTTTTAAGAPTTAAPSTTAVPCANASTTTEVAAASTTTVPGTTGGATNLAQQLAKERAEGKGYKTWQRSPNVAFVEGLKVYGRTYTNAALVQSLKAHKTSHPVGAASVMEAYADAAATKFTGWYVLAKARDVPDPNGWFTYQLTGEPTLPTAPQVSSMANAACSACHGTAASPAYIIASPN